MLSPELIPIHERLVNIRRQLVALAAKETATQSALSAAMSQEQREASPDDEESLKTPTPDDTGETEGESRTPTKDVPNPERISIPNLKAELKPLIEELRKIDSLSDL